MSADLKPCPWCQGEAFLRHLGVGGFLPDPHFWCGCETFACPGAGIGHRWYTETEAVTAWNARAAGPAPVQEPIAWRMMPLFSSNGTRLREVDREWSYYNQEPWSGPAADRSKMIIEPLYGLPAPVSAPLDREGVVEARTQLYALCEHMEDEAIAALAKEPEAHEGGYWRGQKLAAKSISRAMGEVFRELITAPQEPGDGVAAEIAKMEALVSPSFVEMLNELRRDEGDTVTLLCDNPDFNGQPNNAIECNGGWTDWQDRRFTGETLHAAVTAAYTAKTALTGQQDQVGGPTPAVLGGEDIDGLTSQPCADGSPPVLTSDQHSDEGASQ